MTVIRGVNCIIHALSISHLIISWWYRNFLVSDCAKRKEYSAQIAVRPRIEFGIAATRAWTWVDSHRDYEPWKTRSIPKSGAPSLCLFFALRVINLLFFPLRSQSARKIAVITSYARPMGSRIFHARERSRQWFFQLVCYSFTTRAGRFNVLRLSRRVYRSSFQNEE